MDVCRKADCGSCTNCLDKKRFGGPGKKKKLAYNEYAQLVTQE